MAILIEGDNTINVQFVSIAPPKGTLIGGVFIAGTGPNWVPIAGATVQTASRTTTSGSDGSYSFSNLEPGSYDVHFSKSGYQSYSEPVAIRAGQTSELNVALVSVAPPPPPPTFNPWSYDTNGDGVIDTQEMLKATNDYYAGIITWDQVQQVMAIWEQAPPPPPPPPPECATKAKKDQTSWDYFDGKITKEEALAILSLPTCP